MSQFEEWEINKYWEIFSGLSPVNGLLTGDQVSTVFKNSQLQDYQLAAIWDLSDVDSDGCLDFEEFCIAMRLIFDLINDRMSDVPATLPDWLVPQSKAYLVTANNAVRSGPQPSEYDYDDDDDEGMGLSSDFDWYISKQDREQYSAIYSANADYRGTVSFDSLTELYEELNIPETDVRSAWNLVNPRSDEKIEREQCVVFLHILNNRSKGVRVPRMVPASLRATFEKSKPEYDLSSKQSIIRENPSSQSTAKKNAFGEGYLSRLGLGGKSKIGAKGTDFSSTNNTDWEEARLKRKLADLEDQIKRSEEASERRKQGLEDYGSSRSALIRRELEQLLDYKERQLQKLKNGDVDGGSGDLSGSSEEIDEIASQIKALQGHQKKKEEELAELKRQLQAV